MQKYLCNCVLIIILRILGIGRKRLCRMVFSPELGKELTLWQPRQRHVIRLECSLWKTKPLAKPRGASGIQAIAETGDIG
jgi:hypothetical protein